MVEVAKVEDLKIDGRRPGSDVGAQLLGDLRGGARSAVQAKLVDLAPDRGCPSVDLVVVAAGADYDCG
jgi:hypothetical protein